MQKETKKFSPEGIKVISTVIFVFTGITALLGLFLTNYSEIISKMNPSDLSILTQQGIPIPTPGNLLIMGISFFILSGFLYFLGRDLINLKKWARIATGAISVLVTIISLYSVIQTRWSNIIILVIGGLISWYLLINKKIISQFN